jgi:hypothetical protein
MTTHIERLRPNVLPDHKINPNLLNKPNLTLSSTLYPTLVFGAS